MVIRNKRVLVASQANLAVDNALETVIPTVKVPEDESFPALRLGLSDYWKDKNSRVTEKEHLAFLAHSMISSRVASGLPILMLL